jgi:hypothetical protein
MAESDDWLLQFNEEDYIPGTHSNLAHEKPMHVDKQSTNISGVQLTEKVEKSPKQSVPRQRDESDNHEREPKRTRTDSSHPTSQRPRSPHREKESVRR